MVKVALALGYPAGAFKRIDDYYEKGVEFERATAESAVWKRVRERIAEGDRRCTTGLHQQTYVLLAAVIFKGPPSQDAIGLLQNAGFSLRHLPKNPYLKNDMSG